MKNKMRILAMMCAGLLLVGCENSSEDKAKEQATATSEAAATAPAETAVPAAPAQEVGPGMQPMVDFAQGVPAELSTTTTALNAGPGASMTVPVMVKNDSQVSFFSAKDLTKSDNEIYFQITYLDSTGKVLEALTTSIPLPDTLAVGQAGTYQLPVTAPTTAGDYTMQIDLIQQGKLFSTGGVKPVNIPVSLK